MVETLIVLPVLLLVGLGSLQSALVLHAHRSLSWALDEAGRAASVASARPEAALAGLARGLVPWLYGSDSTTASAMLEAHALEHVASGLVARWIVLRQLAPTSESFDDWAEPAVDDQGRAVADVIEIPNDNLVARARRQQPISGVRGYRGVDAIGSSSGQTLSDANLLKLEMVYGVPLVVPAVGRLAVRAMQALDGCTQPDTIRLGAIRLGSVTAGPAQPWRCAFYQGLDERGRETLRWPVRLATIVRMQSAARRSDWTQAGTAFGGDGAVAAGGAGGALGSGPVGRFGDRSVAGQGRAAPLSGNVDVDAPGFLKLGSPVDRPAPGFCPG